MTDNTMTLTKNTDKLRAQVAAHVAADSIIQGTYWDDETNRGCFIGCLAKGDDPAISEETYGLPVMVQRIAENIFEALPADEAKAFFADLPDAIGCDGKDLSKVGWQFLASELRSLPPQKIAIQDVIDQVIAGLDMVISGKEWTTAQDVADAAARAADAAARWAARAAARAADDAARAAAWAAARAPAWAAAWAARAAAWAAAADADAADAAAAAADWAARAAAADAAAAAAADAAAAAADADDADARAAARSQQRDLLLRLISEAPVAGGVQ